MVFKLWGRKSASTTIHIWERPYLMSYDMSSSREKKILIQTCVGEQQKLQIFWTLILCIKKSYITLLRSEKKCK